MADLPVFSDDFEAGERHSPLSPLEAAAKSLWEDQPVAYIWSWDSLMDGSRVEYRNRARAALLAAIEAIPEGMRIESGGVYYATIAKPGLRVLFGLGDQPNG